MASRPAYLYITACGGQHEAHKDGKGQDSAGDSRLTSRSAWVVRRKVCDVPYLSINYYPTINVGVVSGDLGSRKQLRLSHAGSEYTCNSRQIYVHAASKNLGSSSVRRMIEKASASEWNASSTNEMRAK